MYSRLLKRLLDVAISLIMFVLLTPLFVPIVLILIVQFKGRPFFIQCRPGLNERPINVLKFKTMNDDKDIKGNLLPNHQRITRTGRFLRRFSLDELPQLFNVLKGDMSLVGPRPLLFKYISLYSDFQKRRHIVKPGITGWAQVNGRNAISWSRKFELDVWYVENLSLALDMRILWLTLFKWVRPEGVNADETITMPPFNGNN